MAMFLSRNTAEPSSPLSSPPASPGQRFSTPTKRSRIEGAQLDCASSPLSSPPVSQAVQGPSEAAPATPQNKSKAFTVSIDTPMGHTSHGSDNGYDTVELQRPVIEAELKQHIYDAGQPFADIAFRDDFRPDSITSFLEHTDLYREGRWVGIDKKVDKESVLYAPYAKIFDGLLEHFNLKTCRSILASHGIKVPHIEGIEDNRLRSSPDFIIQGRGPLFSPSDTDTVFHSIKLGFGTCASLVDIKTDKGVGSDKFLSHLVQLAVYARQCFIQQQNRFFVYALILTEERARLYQFDRSGVQYSPLINIHDDPSFFVRMLLGISSRDGNKLGFDTSIKWEGECRYLYTLDAHKKPIRYQLASKRPVFSRRAIRGRGTLCHAVIGPDGELRLVKDAWRSKDRTPEWEFLQAARGLAGVGQMVAYEETVFTTAKHRGVDMASFIDAPNPTFHDRMFSRTTLEAYGSSIDKFQTRKQLLYAFRDAIAGHRNLWKNFILHRDISINNILLGNESAEHGNRGVVIDLDMAVWINRTTSLAGADFRTGTRAFQSVMVLRSALLGSAATPHDYLDDLESFFYALCWICFSYERPRHLRDEQPSLLADWEDQNAKASSRTKFMFLSYPIRESAECEVSVYFGDIFLDLLDSLRIFLKGQIDSKMKPRREPREPLESLMPQSDEHYAEVLGYVDRAIEAVEALPEERVDPKQQRPKTSGKRPSTDIPNDSPEPKRVKTRAQVRKEAAAENENPFAPPIPSKLSMQTTLE